MSPEPLVRSHSEPIRSVRRRGVVPWEAILPTRLRGARVYVTLFPCNECTKAIIQKGVAEVIYLSDKYAGTDSTLASKRMLKSAGVKVRQYKPSGKQIDLQL